MAIVTPQQTRACYDAALAVLRGDMRRSDAMRHIAKTTGMKENPAGITIDAMRNLLQHRDSLFPLNTAQTLDVLTWVLQDSGTEIARACAQTVLDRVAATGNGPRHSVHAGVADFLAGLPQPTLAAHLAFEATALTAALARTPADRAARLGLADPMPRTATVTTTVYLRNPDVTATTLLRAAGTCEGCSTPAPFLRRTDNSPYLEVHHRIPLANGGPDTVANAIALCPNCHRHAHHGQPLPAPNPAL